MWALEEGAGLWIRPIRINWFDAFRSLVAGIINASADRFADQGTVGVAGHQGQRLLGRDGRVEPAGFVAALQDQRHSAVDRRNQFVCRGCENRATVDRLDVGLRLPASP